MTHSISWSILFVYENLKALLQRSSFQFFTGLLWSTSDISKSVCTLGQLWAKDSAPLVIPPSPHTSTRHVRGSFGPACLLKVSPRLRQCRQATLDFLCLCNLTWSGRKMLRFYYRGIKSYFGVILVHLISANNQPKEQRWSDWSFDCKCIYWFCWCRSLLMLKREIHD